MMPNKRGFEPERPRRRRWAASLLGARLTAALGLTPSVPRPRHRLHLPFQLLSDSSLHLKTVLGWPTFKVAGMELYKRLTLVSDNGRIEKVFYPVFPPIAMPKMPWHGCKEMSTRAHSRTHR